MPHTKAIINSFLPIFYVSKLFGCNLYPLPCPLDATNLNAPITAIDVLCCVLQFSFYMFIVFPLTPKWNSYDSMFNNEFASKTGSPGLVVIIFIGQSIGNGIIFTNCLIMIMDMRNSATIRKILYSFIKFDEKVSNLNF